MAANKPSVPDIANMDQLGAWLGGHSPEISVAVAARSALRILPVFGLAFRDKEQEDTAAALILPAFRAVALPWVAATFPNATTVTHFAKSSAHSNSNILFSVSNRVKGLTQPIAYAVDAAGNTARTAAAPDSAAGYAAAAAADANAAARTLEKAGILIDDAVKRALAEDVRMIAAGSGAAELSREPLWPEGLPIPLLSHWEALKETLHSLDEHWSVWTEWYEARLNGHPADETLEVARATIPYELWEQGPEVVNAHIRDLIARHGGDGTARTGAFAGSQTADTFSATGTIADALRPSVWLAQCREGDWVWPLVEDARPGSIIPWKIGSAKIDAMRAGDPVVYWRTVTKGRDRGGIIGTGRIVSTETETDENGVARIPTELAELYDDEPLGREEVIEETGLDPGHWHFSLYQVPAAVAERMDVLLKENERQPLFPGQAQQAPRPAEGAGEILFLGDAPKRDEDLLGRAELAFILAARLNRVWDELNSADEAKPGEPVPDDSDGIDSYGWTGHGERAEAISIHDARPKGAYDAGFVVHLDAPWGGGKTTFANYLARILNPYAEPGPLPDWLGKLPLGNERNWPKGFRRPWHVVHFNAWQHQHVDPPWWCFYQAIRKQTAAAVLRETSMQVGNRAIPEPDPAFGYRSREKRLWDWFAAWGREMSWRLFTPELRWSGLLTLATFGLAVLLVSLGWLKVDLEEGSIGGNFADASGTVVALIAILAGGGSFIWTIVSTFTGTLLTGTPDAAKNYSLGSGDPLERFRRHFGRMMERLKRPVLVIVDDIDRCEPAFVVELVRGMQTILRSPRVVFLLLGDRDWIEQSFAEVHKAMKSIPVGPEHSFGGRFVEKAIQLSLMLPDVPAEERHGYVRSLLGIECGAADPVVELETEHREEVESTLAALDEEANPIARDRSAASLRERVYTFQASDQVKEAVAKSIDRKVALRSAADEKVQAATQHRLEPIARVLPPNPRQIKRIINAISLFQEIGRIRAEVQPEKQRWRQLALWIVLMTEWPQTWAALASKPDLLTGLHNPDDATPIDGLDEATVHSWVEAIRAKPEIMALLDFPRYGSGPRNGIPEQWRDARIDADAVRRLTAILPPVGGAMLPRTQPEEEKVGNGETS